MLGRKWIGYLLIFTVLFCFVPASGFAAEKLTIAFSAIGGNIAPIWVTKEKGLFDKHGLDVTLVFLTSSAQVAPALLSGGIQIAQSAGSGVIGARLAGAKIKFVIAYSNYLRFYLYAQKDIRGVADLKGKKAAITRFGTGSAMALEIILEEAGLKMGKDVAIIQNPNLQEGLISLASGAVQGAILAPPSTFKADNLGLKMLVDTMKYRFPDIMAGVAVSEDYLRDRPDIMRSFVKAFVEGIAVSKTDKEFTKKVISKYTKTTDEEILEKTFQVYAPVFEAVPYVPAAAVKSVLNQRAPMIPAARTANPEDFFDNRFVKELEESGFIKALYR